MTYRTMSPFRAPMHGYGFAGHLRAFGADVDSSDVAILWGGDYKQFQQLWWSKDQVYAFRFRASGMPESIQGPSQAFPLVKAYVATMIAGERNQDIRGVCLKPIGPGQYQCEIVVTDAGELHLSNLRDSWRCKAMTAWLQTQGSAIVVDQGDFIQLSDSNKAALQFWFSKPPVWSYTAYLSAGKQAIEQGYTQAYLDGQGVFIGQAKLVQSQVKPVAQPPIAPPSGSGGGGLAPGATARGTITTQIIPGSGGGGTSLPSLSMGPLSDRSKLLIVGGAALGLVLYTQRVQKKASETKA